MHHSSSNNNNNPTAPKINPTQRTLLTSTSYITETFPSMPHSPSCLNTGTFPTPLTFSKVSFLPNLLPYFH